MEVNKPEEMVEEMEKAGIERSDAVMIACLLEMRNKK